jgi:hypothetical protein
MPVRQRSRKTQLGPLMSVRAASRRPLSYPRAAARRRARPLSRRRCRPSSKARRLSEPHLGLSVLRHSPLRFPRSGTAPGHRGLACVAAAAKGRCDAHFRKPRIGAQAAALDFAACGKIMRNLENKWLRIQRSRGGWLSIRQARPCSIAAHVVAFGSATRCLDAPARAPHRRCRPWASSPPAPAGNVSP